MVINSIMTLCIVERKIASGNVRTIVFSMNHLDVSG